jgi:SAM-dependent methyltransferase
MYEMSKSIVRRMADPKFIGRYFVGDGIDIGGAPDPLAQYHEQFPGMRSVRVWDLQDGDARLMHSIADESYHFVHSSHCLEHLTDPVEGLNNWFRIIKPGGYLIVLIPDEDMYEQGVFPSTFNSDHKHTFTLYKTKSWSPVSINVLDLLKTLGSAADIQSIVQLNATFRYNSQRFDQTLTPIGDCAIEFVVRKRLAIELEKGGRFPLR